MARIYRSLHLDESAAAASTTEARYVGFGRKVRLLGVILIANAATAADADDYLDVNVFGPDGTTLLWNRDTDSAGDGALVAGTVEGTAHDADPDTTVAFESGVGAQLYCDEDEAFLVNVVTTGPAGAAIDADILLIAEPAS